MEVRVRANGRIVTATLKVPRAWIVSALVVVSAFLAHVATTQLELRDVRAKLSVCEQRIAQAMSQVGQ